MKKILLALGINMLGAMGATAQQDAAFSQYFFNLLYINPGYAGTRDFISGTLVHRSQWQGIDGAPATQSLSIHCALPKSRLGLGLQLYNDVAGPIKSTGLAATVAYRLPVNDNTTLSFGLSGSVSSLRISGDDIRINNQADQAFSTGSSAAIVPDANAGLYLYKTRFFAGASMTHLLQTKFSIDDISGSQSAKYYRNYFFTAGWVFSVSDNINFRPSALVKYVQAAPIVAEVDGCFIFYNQFYLGAGLRSGKRVGIDGMDNMLVGIAVFEFMQQFRAGYSYDAYLSRGGAYNRGTHEFILGWDFSRTKTKLENPRYF